MNEIHQLEIRLLYVEPAVRRKLLIPASFNFELFHHIIQEIIPWESIHLFHFMKGNVFIVNPEMEDGPLDGTHIDFRTLTLGEVLREEGEKLEYVYDFGDDWKHEITLEKTLSRNVKMQYPRVIELEGVAPPEDIGGPPGYQHLREVLSGPDSEEKEEMLEWLGIDDPEMFFEDEEDIDLVNAILEGFMDGELPDDVL